MVVRGKVVEGCVEDARDVVEAMNALWGMLMGGYGALIGLAENLNLSALRG